MKDCLQKKPVDWAARSHEMYVKAKAACIDGFTSPLSGPDADIWIEAYQCAYDDVIDRLEKLGFTEHEIGVALDLKTWRSQ